MSGCWRSMVDGAKRGKYYSPIDDGRPPDHARNPTCHLPIWRRRSAGAGTRKIRKSQSTISRFNLPDDLDGAAALTAACRPRHLRADRGCGQGGALGTRDLVWWPPAPGHSSGPIIIPGIAHAVFVCEEIRRLDESDAAPPPRFASALEKFSDDRPPPLSSAALPVTTGGGN